MVDEALIITAVKQAWGWSGVDPAEIVAQNEFANLLIKDVNGKYWRLCPEDVYCEVLAQDDAEFDQLFSNEEFLEDWHMHVLVKKAKQEIGALHDDRRYCLATPGVLGGEYAVSNIKTAPLVEIVSAAGDLARQIKDLPDGTKIKLMVKH